MEDLNNLKLRINCIYSAHEGEGIRIGTPQIFVRLQGCAIGCVNCDTKESWDFEESSFQTLNEILHQIEKLKINNVSITGGDPLDPRHTPNLLVLIKILKEKKYFINIEASGSRIDAPIFDLVDFISFDYKTPSTEVKTPVKHLLTLAENYSQKSQIKAVIANQKDFSSTYEVFNKNPSLQKLPWVLTPCFEPGQKLPLELIKNTMQWNFELGSPFRVIVQQHKVIFGPDKRQV